MKMKNRRTSLINCLLNTIPSFITYIIFIIFTKYNKLSIIICILIFITTTTISLIDGYYKTYRVNNKVFIFQKGIINKQIIKIPIENIASINISKKIKYKILGLNNLKINIPNKNEDLIFILSNKALNELLPNLNINNDKKEKVIYQLNNYNTLIFAATYNDIFISTSIIFYYGIIFYGIFSTLIFNNIYNFIIFLLLFLVTNKIIVIIINYLKFKNFKIVSKENILEISRGIFNKRIHSLDLNKISALSISNTILLRKLNKSIISISVCGLGDNENSPCIIFPIINTKDLQDQKKSIFPKFIFDEEKTNISKRHRLRYKTTKYGITKNLIYLEKGIFKKKISIIDKKGINSISYKQNFINKIRNTYKLKINYTGMKIDDLKCINGITTEDLF